jgi:hypothetical protein
MLWGGTYITPARETRIRICEIVQEYDNPDNPRIPLRFTSRTVEMASTFDSMGDPVWTLTEFDADMLLFFLLSPPDTVQPVTGRLGGAGTVAADTLASSRSIGPG